MCGIAGSVGRPLPPAQVLAALAHRGPDDRGELRRDGVQLLHTRLSIVDIAAGAQPMCRGSLAIVYNGEIYNHLELRERHALECRTRSDTETLLALFERRGIDCLAELDGMFAFALHDAERRTLWLARDRAGEKPLYLWTGREARSGELAFASELNALLAALPLEIDEEAVNAFLSSALMHGAATPYRDVVELAPGGWLALDTASGERRGGRWFSIDEAGAERAPLVDEREALERVERALAAAVRRTTLSADVEVGAFLSGGIDSGLVSAFAAREVSTLRTFTVSFEGLFDESPLARAVAERHGTRHRVLEVDFDNLADDLEEIVGNYGEPVCDGSIVPVWYVSRAAREHVKVVLTGDGADEQFGGYRRYVPYAHLDLFDPGAQGAFAARWAAARLPPPRRKHSGYNYLHRLVALLGQGGLERYLASTTAPDRTILAAPAPWPALGERYARLAASERTALRKLMLMDFEALLGNTYLPKMDIGSMAHSLEARSPFLGREVIDVAASLPDRLKIRGRTTKYLLRELAARHLPQSVRRAPKRGFEIPLADWVDGRLREPIHDRLGTPGAWVRRFCAEGALEALLAGRSAHSPPRRAALLWMLFCTETWHAHYRRRSAERERALRAS